MLSWVIISKIWSPVVQGIIEKLPGNKRICPVLFNSEYSLIQVIPLSENDSLLIRESPHGAHIRDDGPPGINLSLK